MSETSTKKEVEEELANLLQQTDARQRYVLRHALAQLTMLVEDEAFGSVTVHVVGGRLRQAKLEQTIQG